MHLLNVAVESSLQQEGDLATWRFWVWDGVPQHPAANDFMVAGALVQGRRFTGTDQHMLEMHLVHAAPTYAAAYADFFAGQVRFGMPHNAIVMRRSGLALPTLEADRGIHAAFELQAQALSARLRRDAGVSARVREVALAQIPKGDAGMELVARKLAMSVATLRRRLEEEGTSHREILDEVRRDLAEHYLGENQLAISEVAFLLGFSHVTALHKAFKRWTGGTTPAEYRAQRWRQGSGRQSPNRLPPSALRNS
jgi:AraC-like DNA-binding protein